MTQDAEAFREPTEVVQRATDEVVQLLRDFLRIDTTNPPGNERPLADLIGRVFAREGIEFRILE